MQSVIELPFFSNLNTLNLNYNAFSIVLYNKCISKNKFKKLCTAADIFTKKLLKTQIMNS